MNKPLPPVGSLVSVRNSDGSIVLCSVTESPMRACGLFPDGLRRIGVVGFYDSAFRCNGVIHRDENTFRSTVWYFE